MNFTQEVKIIAEHSGLLMLTPSEVFIPPGNLTNTTIDLFALNPGKTDILLELINYSSENNTNESE